MKQREGYKEVKLFFPPWFKQEMRIAYEADCNGNKEIFNAGKPGFRNYVMWRLMEATGTPTNPYSLKPKGLMGLKHD